MDQNERERNDKRQVWGGMTKKTKGDMRETDSHDPHKLEDFQGKSKPLLCLSAKARLNKEADISGDKL